MSSQVKKKVVFVLGPPGAGKGTQCRQIADTYDFDHVSAGELLRRERLSPNSQHRELIENCMKSGSIVPADITCMLLENYIEKSTKNYFLIDGFPRNLENRNGWIKMISDKVEILFVLFIDCPIETCIQRCISRGANTENSRLDDTIEIVKKRFFTHVEQTGPIIRHYTHLYQVQFIDGSRAEDKVFDNIKNVFDKFNFPKLGDI